jgi:hypothetical protein
LLTDVVSLTNNEFGTHCALIASGNVDCWGSGLNGELGNGIIYSTGSGGSATPVQVEGVGGSGLLASVVSLSGDYTSGFCAVLTSGGVDCWGGIAETEKSATPFQIVGVGGNGLLTGVSSFTNDGLDFYAVLTSGQLDCWGYGEFGQLGNGVFYTSVSSGSAVPLQVEAP